MAAKICVIIPTRNREELLLNCIKNLTNQNINIYKIIIVDSSDSKFDLQQIEFLNIPLIYIHTTIQSAAQQRNIGLDKVETDCDYIAFIDDDVVVRSNYLWLCIEAIKDNNLIGVSGITLPIKTESPLSKIKRFFYLDSLTDAVVLKSGVNVPVKNINKKIIESEWLIGCAVWKYQSIKKLRFPKEFKGSSLSEDVIFSMFARRNGKIAVVTDIRFDHLESKINRPNLIEFNKMWTVNHFKVVQLLKESKNISNFPFFLSVTGRIVFSFIKIPFSFKNSLLTIIGLFKGLIEVVQNEN